jgi:hypothetical protein
MAMVTLDTCMLILAKRTCNRKVFYVLEMASPQTALRWVLDIKLRKRPAESEGDIFIDSRESHTVEFPRNETQVLQVLGM